MNKKIYLLESGYYTVQNETGMFYVSDKLFQYTVASDSWSQITTLPGTPRWSTDITCVNNEIYVLGGVSGNHISYNVATNSNNQNIYKTIIDNWKYNVDSNTWTRLSDTPLVIGNWMFQHYYEGFIFNHVVAPFQSYGKGVLWIKVSCCVLYTYTLLVNK